MEFNSIKELENYVRGRVRQILNKTDNSEYQNNAESPMNIILQKFPEIRKTLEKLLSPQFEIFVDDVQWVSPKPSTFKVILPNGQFFNLIWIGNNFLIKVSGIKYNIIVLQEYQRAVRAISELLQYGPINVNLSPEDLVKQKLTPADEPVSEPNKTT